MLETDVLCLVNRSWDPSDRIYPPSTFQYDSERDVHICPNACELKYSSVNKAERKKVYRASQRDCRCCSLRGNCIGGKLKCRTIKTSFFKEALDSQHALYATARYFEVQRKRRIFCEGNFGLQKENHNLRQTRKRGNEVVTEHCLCSALALNLKKLMKYLKKPDSLNRLFKKPFIVTFNVSFLKKITADLAFFQIRCSFCCFVNKPPNGWPLFL